MNVCIGGPSWTDVTTAISSAGLLIVAFVAGWIAIRQLRFMDAAEQRRETFRLLRDFAASIRTPDLTSNADVDISPAQALGYLTEASTNVEDFVPAPDGPNTMSPAMGATTANYYVLRNYLDEADDLMQMNIVDRHLFIRRQWMVISDGVRALRRFQQLVSGARNDVLLLDRLEKLLREFED